MAATARLAAAALAAAAVLAPPAAADPTPTAPQTLDSSGLVSQPSGLQMSIARDGSGGLVYLRHDPGSATQHVFLSRLTGGTFAAPLQLDGALGGSSSQPAIAAGNNGVLLIAFVNGGTLYTVTVPSIFAAVPGPQEMAPAAQNPSLAMNNLGKGYLAYTQADGPGYDVRARPYGPAGWGAPTPPLNLQAADSAGTGTARPDVAAAGDGLGIVVWGENGHVYSRRVRASDASPDIEQADAAFDNCSLAGADEPSVGTGGDSSYAAVALRESLTCAGGSPQERVIVRRLRSNAYDVLAPADLVSDGSSQSAGEPQVAANEYGRGYATAVRSDDSVIVTPLQSNDSPGAPQAVNGETDTADPAAVPGLAGLSSALVAWQQTPGASGPADIRLRFGRAGNPLGPESVASSPSGGTTDAADGLAVAGDTDGDSAVAWLQGSPGNEAVVVEQLYQPPGGFSADLGFTYSRVRQPWLAWSAPQELWGLAYTVTLDGQQIARTGDAFLTVPAALGDGAHTWQVTATNPAGQTSTTAAATLFIDATPPVARLRLTGRAIVGDYLHLAVAAADAPPPGAPAAAASGISRIRLSFGDGTRVGTRHGRYHAWHRPGAYRITLTVHDRAGNVTRITRILHIRARPKRKPKRKKTATRKGVRR